MEQPMNYIDYANPKEITLYNGNDLKKYLSGEDFVFLGIKQFPLEILFSVKTGMLWTTHGIAGGFKEWKDPKDKQIIDFVNLQNNPYCNRIFPFFNGDNALNANIDKHLQGNGSLFGNNGYFYHLDKICNIFCSDVLKNGTWQEGFDFIKEQSWQISTLRNEIFLLHDNSLIPTEECGETDPTALQDAIKNDKFIWIGDNQNSKIAIWDLETNILWTKPKGHSKFNEVDIIYCLFGCKSLGLKNWEIPNINLFNKFDYDKQKEGESKYSDNFFLEGKICCLSDLGNLGHLSPVYFAHKEKNLKLEFNKREIYSTFVTINNFFQNKTWEQRAYIAEKYWQLTKISDGKKIDLSDDDKSTIGGDDRIG